jgi:hypothetical protein
MVDTGSTSQAVVQFLPDWLQSQQGAILRGGSVAIEFAPERLTGCRRNWRGAEVWDIEALARFHPRGEFVRGSLMERILTGGVVTALSPRRREIAVPSDTRQIEMWFHNFTEIGGRCDAWDSRFGENYWFDVAGPTPIEPQDPVRYRGERFQIRNSSTSLTKRPSKRMCSPRRRSAPGWARISELHSTCAHG